MKKLILMFVLILLIFITACTDTSTITTPEPTASAEPTATPVPTDTPVPDIDDDIDAVLYRFAYEGENIVDSKFDGEELVHANCILKYTEEGLLITVAGMNDPYFFLPMPDDELDVRKYPILKMLFKDISKEENGELYLGFDFEQITSTDQNYTFPMATTGDWQAIYMDFSEIRPDANKLTLFRADIQGNPGIGSTITVDFIGFFQSLEAAEDYIPPNRRDVINET